MILLTTLLHQFGCFSSFLVEFHYKFLHSCKKVQCETRLTLNYLPEPRNAGLARPNGGLIFLLFNNSAPLTPFDCLKIFITHVSVKNNFKIPSNVDI